MILYINACVRENSRTDELARELLSDIGGEYRERKLSNESLFALSKERLEYRNEQIEKGNFDDPIFDYAKEFADADTIVISAPFWDLSFPAILKMYIENIYVTGIVSRYGENGVPVGLCKADKLYYVTTAGGRYDPRYSYDYIKELCVGCLGINQVQLFKAEMLDIAGNDAQQIVLNAKNEIKSTILSYVH